MYDNNLRSYITKDEPIFPKVLDKGALKGNISKIKLLVADNPCSSSDLDKLSKMVDRFELYLETLLLSKSEVFNVKGFMLNYESNNYTESMKALSINDKYRRR
jgi:hypothetical protein